MDRAFCYIINLTIVGLGAYLCTYVINDDHLSKLIKLGLVEMRDNKPF
jgi:hypothetical protein